MTALTYLCYCHTYFQRRNCCRHYHAHDQHHARCHTNCSPRRAHYCNCGLSWNCSCSSRFVGFLYRTSNHFPRLCNHEQAICMVPSLLSVFDSWHRFGCDKKTYFIISMHKTNLSRVGTENVNLEFGIAVVKIVIISSECALNQMFYDNHTCSVQFTHSAHSC